MEGKTLLALTRDDQVTMTWLLSVAARRVSKPHYGRVMKRVAVVDCEEGHGRPEKR